VVDDVARKIRVWLERSSVGVTSAWTTHSNGILRKARVEVAYGGNDLLGYSWLL
jgi:hypothetical protein